MVVDRQGCLLVLNAPLQNRALGIIYDVFLCNPIALLLAGKS
jgi:hypothetical protein